jgi:CheY-like chemotaxis protein
MPNPRVMVADDHDETRAQIASLLASEFDVVATVADGRAAVEACSALGPDLVVLDIAMPRLNGFEAAAIVRDLPDPPRIVFVTAHDDAEFSRAACGLGASALVPKWKMAVDLVPAIRRALNFHAVFLYDDVPSLAHTVGGFIGEGLLAGQAAVVIATAPHGAAVREHLVAIGVDTEERTARDELLIVDADDMLDLFMVDGLPDAERFKDALTPIMERATGSRKRLVRAYGEMVDVLWRNDNEAAALSLEALWNRLGLGRTCSVLCGYSSADVGTGAGLDAICDQHSHVVGEHGR